MPSRALAERYPDLLAVGGHPSIEMPPHVVEAATRTAADPAYAPTHGTSALRAAIAERLSGELARAVDPAREVLVTLGGMQGLHLACSAFGARSVSHGPSFFFPQMVEVSGGSCVRTGGASGPPDWEAWGAAIGRDTTLAIVNAPVNPTGYVLRPHDLDAIAAALRDSEALLLSDEAYQGVVYGDHTHLSPATHPELAGRTLVLRSFSKSYGMAAWRVGYAVGPPVVIETLAKAFMWQSLAIDAVAQAAALAALTGPQDWIEAAVAELGESGPLAVAAANRSGLLRAEVPESAAFVWAAVEGDEEAWSEHLALGHGIPALPGRHFGATTPHLRVPFGGRPDARAALYERLASVTAPS